VLSGGFVAKSLSELGVPLRNVAPAAK